MDNNILKYLSMATLALVMAAACDDDSGYEPGPATASDTISAYFASSNESSYTFTPEEYAASDGIDLTVSRLKADAAATVPITVVSADDVFDIPSSVSFAAGEASATIRVTYSGLATGTDYSFIIRLADEYTDHYAQLDGSPVFTATVMIANWKKVVEDALFYDSDGYFPKTYSDIYVLEGQNKFYIEDFLGTGVNLGFTLSGGEFSYNDKATWSGYFQLTDHYVESVSDGYLYWYLLDDDGAYAKWDDTVADYYIYGGTTSSLFNPVDMLGSETSYAGYLYGYIDYADDSVCNGTYILMCWDEKTNMTNLE